MFGRTIFQHREYLEIRARESLIFDDFAVVLGDQKWGDAGRATRTRRTFLQLAQLPITKKIQAFSLAWIFCINRCFRGTASSQKDTSSIVHSYISAHASASWEIV